MRFLRECLKADVPYLTVTPTFAPAGSVLPAAGLCSVTFAELLFLPLTLAVACIGPLEAPAWQP